jgi:hypothetical protein
VTITDAQVNEFCLVLAAQIPKVTFESGEDDGRYVNLFVDSDDAVALWNSIDTILFSDRMIGPEVRTASIPTITGPNGWYDYLLLHHFDPTEPLETIEN